ncbi:LPXTG cell wall anchor domain-containing protein [Glutamicibacter soli]|uniref:LPXTG cell wall anchor domain-containing protein n=1 Tax=Glutamicibacter soli TaxID=453836 RepID=UPI003C706967
MAGNPTASGREVVEKTEVASSKSTQVEGELAKTGANASITIVAGGLLLAAAGIALTMSRRRNKH